MKYLAKLSSAALLLALSAPAFAQSSDDTEIEEIIVRATHLYADKVNALRSPTPIIDVPQSLSIVTAEQITNQGFDSIGDIINYLPGVTNTQGEGHRDAIVFRGVRSTADFFLDGGRDDVQYYRPLYNLEQVEVLRGANALLFGRGGTGGLVNRVTKKAEIGEQFTGYKVAADTFGSYSAEFDANIDAGDIAVFRVNGLYESLDNHRDFFDGETIAVNPTLRLAVSDATTFDLSYEYIDSERFIDRGIPTGADGRPVEALSGVTFGDPEENTTELTAHILRAALTRDFTDTLKGVLNVSYADFDKLYQNYYASGYDPLTNIVTLDGYRDTTQRKNFNASGNLIGEWDTGFAHHTVVTGLEYISTTNNNDRFNTFFDQTSDDRETFIASRPLSLRGGVGTNAAGNNTVNDFGIDLNDDTEADVKVWSAFIQDEIALSDNFDVILGARLDRFDIKSIDTKPAVNVTRSRTDEEISPRLGLIYKPAENVSIYGSYSQSFLPRSGGQFASLSSSTEFLNPDVFENREAGIKWDFWDDMSLTAALFQNEQTTAGRDDVNSEQFEIRGLEVEGFEIQLEGHITPELYVRAGYANMSGKTDNGAELPRELPQNTFSVWSNYQVTNNFGLGLGATYQDEAFISDFDIGISNAATHPTLPSFTRIDAAAYYDIREDVRMQVNIENLTDELYFPTSHSTHQATVAAPLNARFTVSGQF